MTVRALEQADLSTVAQRVSARLAHDAMRNALVNDVFDADIYVAALGSATDQAWVAEENGQIVGHLFGTVLDSAEHGRSAWTGPDGVSYDSDHVLDELYRAAGHSWTQVGAEHHFAWVFDHDHDTRPWFDLGFTSVHCRGVMPLASTPDNDVPEGYTLRRGDLSDLSLAVELDQLIDEAQFQVVNTPSCAEGEWRELLEDDEVHHYVVDFEGRGVAQCVTFPLGSRRGSFDHTLHLSAVAVRPEHEHRGVARAMVTGALNDALHQGFAYVETNWAVANDRAAAFWTRFGFRPTYVRLQRTVELN
jgi:GNAT superfamily N-acetyltransferase